MHKEFLYLQIYHRNLTEALVEGLCSRLPRIYAVVKQYFINLTDSLGKRKRRHNEINVLIELYVRQKYKPLINNERGTEKLVPSSTVSGEKYVIGMLTL